MPIDLPTTPVEIALHWAAQGWLVFPCKNTDKAPHTGHGFKDGMTDEAEIREAWTRHPNALVGGATGNRRSVVDLDCKPGEIDGRVVWAHAITDIDTPTVFTQQTPSGGIHRVYNKIEGHPSIGQYPWFGFDIRNDGGYIILPGSVMADGSRYELLSWTPENRPDSTLDYAAVERRLKEENPQTRALWLTHLTREREKREKRNEEARIRRGVLAAPEAPRTGKLVAPLQTAKGGGTKAANQESWLRVEELVAELNDCPEGVGHREISRICFEAGNRIVRNGQADEQQVIDAFINGLRWTYEKPGDEYAVHRDIEKCVRDGVARGAGEPWRSGIRQTTPPPPPPVNRPAGTRLVAPLASPEPPVGLSGLELPVLPDAFYEGSPELEHIRAEAHGQGVSAPATVMAVLTIIASMTDHRWTLPGTPSSLSLFTAMIAPSGHGKSEGYSVARQLLPGWDWCAPPEGEHPNDYGHDLQISHAAGMIEAHYTTQTVEVEDSKGNFKEKQVRVPTVHNIMWHVDEGESLVTALNDREGFNPGWVIRQGWQGKTLSQTNVGDKKRHIDAMSYNWGIYAILQPIDATRLVGDTSRGTAQRFMWVNSYDPGIPELPDMDSWVPRPVKQLDWKPARPSLSTPRSGDSFIFDVPKQYRHEAEQWKRDRTHGKIAVPDLESHYYLNMFKLAAQIAQLHGKNRIDDDSMRRARMLAEMSREIGRWLVSRSDITVAEENARKADQQLSTYYQTILRRAAKETLQRGYMTRGQANTAIGGKRCPVSDRLDEMLEMGVDDGALEVIETAKKWRMMNPTP